MRADLASAPEPVWAGAPEAIDPDIDADAFKRYYRDRGLPRVRVALGLGLLLVVALSGLDLIFAPRDYAIAVIPWRMFLMFVPMGIALAVTLAAPLQRWITHAVTAAAMLAGLGAVGTGVFAGDLTHAGVIWGIAFFTFYPYLVLGLPYRPAAAAALPTLLSTTVLAVALDTPAAALTQSVLFLMFSNAIGLFSCYRLERNARALYRRNRELQTFAQVDGLTNLNNRRMLDDFLTYVWGQSRREQKNLAVLLVDIDGFKAYNDHYGHPAGDACLREVANVIRESVRRPLDFVARYGGEEFAVVLYAPTAGYLEMFAENLRAMIAALEIEHIRSPVDACVTASIGAGLFAPDCPLSLDEALAASDAALYKAKQAGRNRVSVAVWGSGANRAGAGSDTPTVPGPRAASL